MVRQPRLKSSVIPPISNSSEVVLPSKIEFVKQRANCNFCRLFESCREPLVLDNKQDLSKVKFLFIGEAPGEREDIEGLPFVGKSGQLLRDILKDVGFDSQEIYFANAVKCRPPKNATPTDKQIDCCLDFILNEVDLIKPKAIILLGSVAANAFGFDKAISLLRGKVYQNCKFEFDFQFDIFFLFHPAYILRNMDQLETFIADLQYMMTYDPKELERIESEFYLNHYGQAKKFEHQFIALDFETTGYDFPCKVLSYAVSDGDRSICFAWDKQSKWLLEQFLNNAELVLAHNVSFEFKVLKQEQVQFDHKKFRDTMLMGAFVNENRSNSLKELSYLIGFGGYEDRLLPCHISKLSDYPIEQWYKYNCADVYCTVKLWEYFQAEIRDLNLETLLEKVSQYQNIIADMELTGVQIDMQLFNRYRELIKVDIEKVEKELHEDSAVKDMLKEVDDKINFNSSQQLGKLITKYMRIDIPDKTKTGQPVTDAQMIQRLSRLHSNRTFFKWFGIYKKLLKLQGTYLEGFDKLINKQTNRVYPKYNIIGAITGRTSSENPNFQNIPLDYKEDILKQYSMRKIFIPRAGFKLLLVDYSQLELRVMAGYAPEKAMLACFKNGEDLHQKTALFLQIDRLLAKGVNFGLIYNGDGDTLKGALEKKGIFIELYDSIKFYDGFHRLYPGIKKFAAKVEKQLIEKGYVQNWFGRRRRFSNYNSLDVYKQRHALNAAVNAPIQSTARDMLFLGAVLVHECIIDPIFNREIFFIGDIHDALLFEIMERHISLFSKILRSCLVKQFEGFPCPLDIEISVGDSWGTLQVYKSLKGVK